MTKLEKELVGIAIYLAKDKRSHLMLEDCLKWEKVKTKEISRLLGRLEHIEFTGSESVMKDICRRAGLKFTNPSG